MSYVNILPCSGIGKALGTLSRWSAFELVKDQLPEKTRLLCLARLVVADDESKDQILTHPNITLDGCPKKCALKNIERNGGKVEQSFLMAKFLVKHRDLKIDTQNVMDPGLQAQELAKRIATDVAQDVEKILKQQEDA